MKNDKELSDASIMWFGIHKGKQLEDVPASYLLWLYENNKCPDNLRKYIDDNMDILKIEAKK